MKILTTIPLMGAGGAETVAETLVLDQLRRGEPAVVASAGGFRLASLTDAGAAVVTLPLRGRHLGDLLASVQRLHRACRRHRPDLVHAHNVKATVVARLAVGTSVPILATVHGVPDRDYRAAGWLVGRGADHVVAVSADVADRLHAHGVPRSRLSVVENGIQAPQAPSRTSARAVLGLPPTATVVACVARLAPQKRHDLLIEALRHADPAWARSLVVLLVGDGPTRPSIEAAVAAAGLGDRVRLLGERTDVPQILAASDLAVLPTSWEGLPISVLEAMALGVPVVATDVGDLRGALGAAVHLVEPDSAKALADALHSLTCDPRSRARLARLGRVTAASRFGSERMVAAYRDRYAALADRPTTTAPTTTAPSHRSWPEAHVAGSSR